MFKKFIVKYFYEMPINEYNKKMEQQNNKCSICDSELGKKTFLGPEDDIICRECYTVLQYVENNNRIEKIEKYLNNKK
jgi:hypothetical protein